MLLLWENRMLSPERRHTWWHFRQWDGMVRLILPCCHCPHSPEGKSERLCGWRLRVELSLVAVKQNAQQGLGPWLGLDGCTIQGHKPG